MGRKKIVLARIENESKRKSTLIKRRRGFLKKLKELSTLCNVKSIAIIYSPGEDYPILQPSREEVMQVILHFNALPEFEKTLKMLNHEAYLVERIRKGKERIDKEIQKHDAREIKVLVQQIIQNQTDIINELNVKQLEKMSVFLSESLKKMNLYLQGQDSLLSLPPHDRVSQIPQDFGWEKGDEEDILMDQTFIEEIKNNKYFLEAMSEDPQGFSYLTGGESNSILPNVEHVSNSSKGTCMEPPFLNHVATQEYIAGLTHEERHRDFIHDAISEDVVGCSPGRLSSRNFTIPIRGNYNICLPTTYGVTSGLRGDMGMFQGNIVEPSGPNTEIVTHDNIFVDTGSGGDNIFNLLQNSNEPWFHMYSP